MRGPMREELEKTPPPALRMGSKTTQAYLEMRRKILTGEYVADQVIIPKHIEEEYRVNNTTTQVLLARLANASSIERQLFELSPDDPAPLLKLQRQIFDREGQPLAIQFLTIKAEQYRLQYSFSLDLGEETSR